MGDESSKVAIQLEYQELNKQAVANAKEEIAGLESSNKSAAESFNKFGESAAGASSKLAGLNNEVHSSTAAFTRAERNILHITAILYSLKEVYSAVQEGVELYHAKIAEQESYVNAAKAQGNLHESIVKTIDSLEEAKKVSAEFADALRSKLNLADRIKDAGAYAKALHDIAIQIEGVQTPREAASVRVARLEFSKAQADVEIANAKTSANVQAQTFVDLYNKKRKIIEDLADIESEKLKGDKDEANKQTVLKINTDKAIFENEQALADELSVLDKKQFEEKQATTEAILEDQKKADDTQLAVDKANFDLEEKALQDSYDARGITADEFHKQMLALIEERRQAEIDAIGEVADAQQQEDLINTQAAQKIQTTENAIRVRSAQDDKKLSDERLKIKEEEIGATSSLLGSAASAAKLYGAQGFAAYKAFAIAQAVVATALAVVKALAEVVYPANIFVAAAAAAAGAVQIATIAAASPSGYAEGGLVPGTPSSRDNRIAAVATGEYIFDAGSVASVGAETMAAMHASIRSGQFAFYGKGTAAPPRSSSSFAGGGLVGALDVPGRSGADVAVGFLNSRQDQLEFLRKRGVKVIVDAINRRTQQIAS